MSSTESKPAAASGAELPVAAIDRASPVPFYFQLVQLLEEEIVSGRWEPGTRVPSEHGLCTHYDLSRTTIRQALSRLEQQGLLSREKGRGTFVSDSRPRSWLIQSTEGFFHDEFLRAGHKVTSRVLRLERTHLPLWACDALSIPPDSEGLIIERLRSVDALVALYVVNCLPAFAADVVEQLDTEESLYQRLAEKSGIAVIGGNRTLEAVTAGPRLASLLEVDAGTPLAYIESVSWDAKRRPVDCYQAWLRTDRMRVNIQVSAQRADNPQLSYLAPQVLR